ncbi:MAG: TerC family protein [Candidatus Magasanikbacteria bacterium]|nr:TerC family protein [Candidatus Magasanikbacteria bacterium]
MDPHTILWTVFGIFMAGFLIVDLGYFNRQAHKVSTKSALLQSLFWIGASLIFAALVYWAEGRNHAVEFLSAYVTEKMLSVDNLFVIMLIFSFFKLEEKYHHKVLFWGILGAVVFRGVFITAGSFIVSQFHWVLYIFGAILLYTGITLLKDKKEEHIDFHQNKVVKFAHKYLSFTANHHNGKFWVKENGKFYFTTLFLVMMLVESTDIVFAVDSIPAAFAISQSPFIIFTSNIFAVMGLRALFFLLENVLHKFHHLQKGLAFILLFIGAKMLAGIFDIHIAPLISFGVIMSALIASLILSVIFPKKI